MSVGIGAVQSNMSHDRQQKETEPVDDYAQYLRNLFYKGYVLASTVGNN